MKQLIRIFTLLLLSCSASFAAQAPSKQASTQCWFQFKNDDTRHDTIIIAGENFAQLVEPGKTVTIPYRVQTNKPSCVCTGTATASQNPDLQIFKHDKIYNGGFFPEFGIIFNKCSTGQLITYNHLGQLENATTKDNPIQIIGG